MTLPLVDPRARLLKDPTLLQQPAALTDPRVLAAPDLIPDEEWRKVAEHNNYRTLSDIGMGLAIAFQVWRILGQGWLMSLTPPKNSVDGVMGLGGTFVGIGGQHIMGEAARYKRQYQLMVEPAIKHAFRLGDTSSITGPEEETFAAHYAGQLFDYINASSAEAVMDSYASQLRDRWSSDLAWQRALHGYGLDRRSMTSYTRMLLSSNPTTQLIPDTATRFVNTALATRAELLGKTESQQALQMGKTIRWMMARQRGLLPADARRKWLTAEDEKVCPVCGPMDEVSVDLAERFTLPSREQVWAPGVHPNCRCDVVLDYPDAGLEMLTKAYDPHESRDEHGRWSESPRRVAVLQEAPVVAPVVVPVVVPVVAPVVAPAVAPVVTPVVAPAVAPVMAPVSVPVIAPVAAPVAVPTLQPAPVSVPVIAPVQTGGGDEPEEAPAYYVLADDALRTHTGRALAEDPNEYGPGDEVSFKDGVSTVRARPFYGHLDAAEAAQDFYEAQDPGTTPPLDHFIDENDERVQHDYDVVIDEIHNYAIEHPATIVHGYTRHGMPAMSSEVLSQIYINAGRGDQANEFPESMLRDNLVEVVDTQSDKHLADSYLTAIELGWYQAHYGELAELQYQRELMESAARREGHRVEIPKMFIFTDHRGDLEDTGGEPNALIDGDYYVTHVQVTSTRTKAGGDNVPAMIPAMELIYLEQIGK